MSSCPTTYNPMNTNTLDLDNGTGQHWTLSGRCPGVMSIPNPNSTNDLDTSGQLDKPFTARLYRLRPIVRFGK